MYSSSRFSELIQEIPKSAFQSIVSDTKNDRYVKSLKTWDLLLLMIYGQVEQSQSLRQLVNGYNLHEQHHYHLNTSKIKRSTLSDALGSRSVEAFKALSDLLMQKLARTQRKELNSLTTLIDATPIKLLNQRFRSWTEGTQTPRSRGLKVHVAMNLDNSAITYANITAPNVNDIQDVKNIPIEPGRTYVFDKGYSSYKWWHEINQKGAVFVTRIKRNSLYKCLPSNQHMSVGSVVSDDTIMLSNKCPRARANNPYSFKPIRLVRVAREEGKPPLDLITNDFERSSQEISQLYKDRWQIELLFKWIKQKLKLKTFFGQSENAVKIQIHCALIAYMLILLLKQSRPNCTNLYELMMELKYGLFQRHKTEYAYYRKRKKEQNELKKFQGVLNL